MKYIFFLFLLPLNTVAQDCAVIDSFNFHGVKFGSPLPVGLKTRFKVYYEKYHGDSILSIKNINYEDSLNSWLDFGRTFSSVNFYSAKDGKLYSVLLFKSFDSIDSASVKQGHTPQFYEDVTKELTSIFGSPKEWEDPNNGLTTLHRIWECNKQSFDLEMSYKALMYISLIILNKDLDKERKILKYTNK